MEERNMELDDDGKIRIRRAGDGPAEGETEDEIVIEVPEFDAEAEPDKEEEAPAEEEFLRRREARERELESRRAQSLTLYEEGERLFAEGDLDGAGEKFLDSAALYGADWRSWFGVVRVQTKDLTDFSEVAECEQAYDKALRRMSREDRAAVAAKYVPSLQARADELAAAHERYTAQDEREREEARPALLRELRSATAAFASTAALLAVFLIASVVLWSLINTVQGVQILVPAIVCSAVAIVFVVLASVFARRFALARVARSRNARAGTTEAGEKARMCAELEEVIRSVVEDLDK